MEALVRRWQKKGPVTANAGTAYTVLCEPGSDFGRVIINRLTITNQGTAHTLSVMQVLNRSKTGAAANASQAVFKLTDAEVTRLGIATGDWVSVEMFDGSFHTATVTVGASSGGLTTITMASNFAKAVNLNAKVFFFDLPASHEQITVPTSATTTYESDYGYFGANEKGDPILIHVTNTVAASTINAIICPVIDV